MNSAPVDRGWLQAGLICLAALLAAILALEGVLRTTHWFGARVSWSRPDARIGWRFAPNVDFWYDSRENDHAIVGRTNGHGWNDRDWSPNRAPGTFRVAVLGDSYVEALQVEQSRNFLALAASTLSRQHERRFELMNFGRSGFTQTEQWLVLKDEVVGFKPDAVALFYYAANDIADVDPGTSTDPLRPFPVRVGADEVVLDMGFARQKAFLVKSLTAPIKNHSALASLLAERLAALQQSRRVRMRQEVLGQGGSRADATRGIGGYLSLASDNPDPSFKRNYATTKLLVEAMARFCTKRGIAFLLVAVDTPDYLPDVEAQLGAIDPSFRFGFFDEDLARLAAGTGAHFLGLSGPFRARHVAGGEALHFSPPRQGDLPIIRAHGHPGHWNYEGHRYVAELFGEKLREMAKSHLGPSGDGVRRD